MKYNYLTRPGKIRIWRLRPTVIYTLYSSIYLTRHSIKTSFFAAMNVNAEDHDDIVNRLDQLGLLEDLGRDNDNFIE